MEVQGSWLAIAPPMLAIIVALLFRSVIPALFLGLWLAAGLLNGAGALGFIEGFFDTVAVHVVEALADEDHASIILFSFMIGGLVGIVGRSGGLDGVLAWMARRAMSRRQGQVSTAMLGLLLFIDDYANALVVGKTMQPLTRRLRISAEKLAYLVDSTAAPVSAVALISTWIGYQLGLIGDALGAAGGAGPQAYWLFMQSLAYSFYPWLCLYFVFRIAFSGRDFGPMHAAEQRALSRPIVTSGEADDELTQGRAVYAVVPVMLLVLGVLCGLYMSGSGSSLSEIIGSASPYQALIWGSLVATAVALIWPWLGEGPDLASLLEGWIEGMQSMLFAMIVLVLAWALAGAIRELYAAEFLAQALQGHLPPALLPGLVFVVAAAIAFATGTSWGTMGILIPLIIPLALSLAPQQAHILQAGLAAVLAGAIWGDHCSPISDTTILSSMACGCDHVAHVHTQLPYALLTGLVALLLGFLPAGLGWPAWLCLLLGGLALEFLLRLLGRRQNEQAAGEPARSAA